MKQKLQCERVTAKWENLQNWGTHPLHTLRISAYAVGPSKLCLGETTAPQ